MFLSPLNDVAEKNPNICPFAIRVSLEKRAKIYRNKNIFEANCVCTLYMMSAYVCSYAHKKFIHK